MTMRALSQVSLAGPLFMLAKNTIAVPWDTGYGMFPGIILSTFLLAGKIA